MAYAIAMIDGNGIIALRRVVDVSGDGIETPPWFGTAILLPQARRMAMERDVLVNGLAITTDFANLLDYYRDQVIVGPGSFVIEALGFEDFKRSIREKLRREFSFTFTSQAGPEHGSNEIALKAD